MTHTEEKHPSELTQISELRNKDIKQILRVYSLGSKVKQSHRTYKKTQIKLLEVKITMFKVKNILDWIGLKADQTLQKNNKLE